MQTLVFSDTHFTKRFNRRQFNALAKLISESQRIIINGDFWEGLSISFDDFLKSGWNKLFPLLKQKETIYIYGNHDDKIFSDERVYQFCNKAVDEYCLETADQNYLFKHGQEYFFPKFLRDRHEAHSKRARTLRMRLSNAKNALIQQVGFGVFGPNILPAAINRFPGDVVKNQIGKPGYLLVCGHTHRPQFLKEQNLLDIGFFSYGWANYLIIDSEGHFKLTSERY